MGNYVQYATRVSRLLFRPLKNYNVENRALKVISKEKPTPAPQYASTAQQIKLVNEMEPDYSETSKKRDENLDNFLKKVYVTSNNQVQEIDSRYDPNRPLPKSTEISTNYEFGFYEPKVIKEGKITVRLALEMLTKHNKDKTKYTKEVLAEQYKLTVKLVGDIIDYYKIYQVYDRLDEKVARPMLISRDSGITVMHRLKPGEIAKKIKKDKKTTTLSTKE